MKKAIMILISVAMITTYAVGDVGPTGAKRIEAGARLADQTALRETLPHEYVTMPIAGVAQMLWGFLKMVVSIGGLAFDSGWQKTFKRAWANLTFDQEFFRLNDTLPRPERGEESGDALFEIKVSQSNRHVRDLAVDLSREVGAALIASGFTRSLVRGRRGTGDSSYVSSTVSTLMGNTGLQARFSALYPTMTEPALRKTMESQCKSAVRMAMHMYRTDRTFNPSVFRDRFMSRLGHRSTWYSQRGFTETMVPPRIARTLDSGISASANIRTQLGASVMRKLTKQGMNLNNFWEFKVKRVYDSSGSLTRVDIWALGYASDGSGDRAFSVTP